MHNIKLFVLSLAAVLLFSLAGAGTASAWSFGDSGSSFSFSDNDWVPDMDWDDDPRWRRSYRGGRYGRSSRWHSPRRWEREFRGRDFNRPWNRGRYYDYYRRPPYPGYHGMPPMSQPPAPKNTECPSPEPAPAPVQPKSN